MQELDSKSLQKLQDRQENNSLRTLGVPNNLIDFSSNDYLGFSKNQTIYNDSLQLLERYNQKFNGATGSRLISGNHKLYKETEIQIANFHSTDKALIFNSGYTANVGLITTVAQRHDIIFYDELCHASIREGISLSHANSYKFKHNNLEDLNHKLNKANKEATVYIITESVFSMDGDSPDIEKLISVSKKYKSRLIIDEAHALGVFGEKGCGLINANTANSIFARVITFGKALGCHGAVVLGSNELIQFLVNFSKPFIYTTGLPPHAIATIQSAYNCLKNTSETHQLKENIRFFNTQAKALGLSNLFTKNDSAIQCALIPGNQKVKHISEKLQESGFNVKAILSPTVPLNEERLRFCLHNYNSTTEITEVLTILKTLMS